MTTTFSSPPFFFSSLPQVPYDVRIFNTTVNSGLLELLTFTGYTLIHTCLVYQQPRTSQSLHGIRRFSNFSPLLPDQRFAINSSRSVIIISLSLVCLQHISIAVWSSSSYYAALHAPLTRNHPAKGDSCSDFLHYQSNEPYLPSWELYLHQPSETSSRRRDTHDFHFRFSRGFICPYTFAYAKVRRPGVYVER